MIEKLIKNHEQVQNPEVRAAYGRVSGIFGICSNILVVLMKLIASALTGSVSIFADAMNNVTDVLSSVITLVSFQISGKRADKEHPYGHGRMEYLSGLIVSLLIILVGAELLKTSVERIFAPQTMEFTLLTAGILLLSILVKFVQYRVNLRLAKQIDSSGLAATAKDSLSDVFSTLAVLLGCVASLVLPFSIDGVLGVFVAILILRTGISAARDTLDPLLGKPPSEALVADIRATVLAHPQILGMHDLMVHDYGPGRSMMSMHAEVDFREDILYIHDVIDSIERELAEKFKTIAVIHMDPLVIDDPQINEMRARMEALACAIEPSLTVHDFRMTSGGLHTNLIFDVAVPYAVTLSDEMIEQALREAIAQFDGTYYAIIAIDRVYH